MMELWLRVLVLSIGGAMGVNARYWLSVLIVRWTSPRFPWSTVLINVTGSFAIGFLAVLLTHRGSSPLARIFLITGFLGGYTTFSSFSYESLQLWEDGKPGLAIANTIGSVAAGLIAVTLGVMAGRAVVSPIAGTSPGVARVATDHLTSDEFLEGEAVDG